MTYPRTGPRTRATAGLKRWPFKLCIRRTGGGASYQLWIFRPFSQTGHVILSVPIRFEGGDETVGVDEAHEK
jgi:hypothetical protein